MKLNQLADYIFEVEKYTELDYDFAESGFAAKFDGWNGGGCSCIAKQTEDKQMLIGRNMDLTISNKPAYVVRTECPGKHKTVGIAYSYFSGPDYEDVLKNGVDDAYAKVLPFMCCDTMNDAGLYIEINMRNGENNADGSSKFGCSGTNPGAHRVCSMNLVRYIGENCASVDEAVEYVKSLDLYTPTENIPWNFTFIIADKSGHFGLLEIADNKVSWLDGQQAQTNFYLTKEFNEKEEMKCGLGRYDMLMKGLGDVQNEDDMFQLIDKATYFRVYRENPTYDVRTEYVAIEPDWTTDFVLGDENAEVVQARVQRNIERIGKLTRKELQDATKYWESIFTVVANCNSRELRVRFFEDNERVFKFGL
ncbi:MAG: linear amide C-N hydrolase [Clostridiales bacterium]|nr:linear amide C-N hydrolase [Candidatus Crickella equi]